MYHHSEEMPVAEGEKMATHTGENGLHGVNK